MYLTMLKSKIHRATITEADLNYQGSLTLDKDLMDAAGMMEYEKVDVLNIHTGDRFATYLIEGKRGSGVVCLNGAAARLGHVGDLIIIITYAHMTPEEAKDLKPRIVLVDAKNRIVNEQK